MKHKTTLIERQAAQSDHLRISHDAACMLVAKMHEAAVGKVVGPHHGVVEDVAYVRKERDQLRDQVTLLRDVIKEVSLVDDWPRLKEVLDATEPKP